MVVRGVRLVILIKESKRAAFKAKCASASKDMCEKVNKWIELYLKDEIE